MLLSGFPINYFLLTCAACALVEDPCMYLYLKHLSFPVHYSVSSAWFFFWCTAAIATSDLEIPDF